MAADTTDIVAAVLAETLETLRQQLYKATGDAAAHRRKAAESQRVADSEAALAERAEERARQWKALILAAKGAPDAARQSPALWHLTGAQLVGNACLTCAEGFADEFRAVSHRYGPKIEGRRTYIHLDHEICERAIAARLAAESEGAER